MFRFIRIISAKNDVVIACNPMAINANDGNVYRKKSVVKAPYDVRLHVTDATIAPAIPINTITIPINDPRSAVILPITVPALCGMYPDCSANTFAIIPV